MKHLLTGPSQQCREKEKQRKHVIIKVIIIQNDLDIYTGYQYQVLEHGGYEVIEGDMYI